VNSPPVQTFSTLLPAENIKPDELVLSWAKTTVVRSSITMVASWRMSDLGMV